MSILNNISKAPGAFYRGAIEPVGKFFKSFFVEGYDAAAKHTMHDHTPLSDDEKASNKHNLLLRILPTITLYPIGLIAGFTVIPLIRYTALNFNKYLSWTNNRIEYYTHNPEENRTVNLEEIKYRGGIFGIIGAPIGLLLGTIFSPELYKKLWQETVTSTTSIWGEIGYEIARMDEKTPFNRKRLAYTSGLERTKASLELIFKPATEDDRRTLSKVLGYIPFGIPVGILFLTIALTGHTLARIVLNSFYSLANSIVYLINKSLFDSKIPKLGTPYPNYRNYYKQILGFPGLIIGSTIGLGVGSVIITFRVIYESALNFKKWAQNGFYLPLSDDNKIGQAKPYEFEYKQDQLKLTDPRSITKAFNLSWHENLLGAPGYLLAPVALAFGFAVGSTIRIIAETAFSIYNTGATIISHVALKGVQDLKPAKLFENRKWYEHIIGAIGYPIGLITLPFAALILSARYVITNYDTAKRSYYRLAHPIHSPDYEDDGHDRRPDWIKASSFPGAILGGTLGSTVRIVGESIHTFKRSVKLTIKFSLIDAPEEYTSHKSLDTATVRLSNNTNIWGIPGYIISPFVALPTAGAIIFGRLALTNGTSFKRAFANEVNPQIQTAERKIVVGTIDRRTDRLQQAGKVGEYLGWGFGKLGIVAVDSRARFEYAVMQSMQVAAYEHRPLHKDIRNHLKQLEANINHHPISTGGPGLVLGYITGAIAATVFTTGRIFYNTAVSIGHVTYDMVGFVTHRGQKFPEAENFAMLTRLRLELAKLTASNVSKQNEGTELTEGRELTALNLQLNRDRSESYTGYDEYLSAANSDTSSEYSIDSDGDSKENAPRRDKRKLTPFLLGILGIPLGGITGLLAASTVGFLRFAAQSVITTWNVSLIVTRKSLPKNDFFNIDQGLTLEQSDVDKAMGILGNFSGFGLGIVGFVIGGTLRTLVDTGISIGHAVYNIATLPPVSGYLPELKDEREELDIALGAPLGYLIGAPLGVAFYALHITVHVVINSFKTGYTNLQKMIPWSFGDEETSYLLGQHPNNRGHININDKRNFKEMHAFGIFGHVVGGALGVAIGGVVITGRMLWHTLVRSPVLGFKQFTNLARTTEMKELDVKQYDNSANKIAIPFVNKPLKIPPSVLSGFKYISGLPGLALGTAASAVFYIMPNYAYVFIKENINSAKHLGRSLINLGGEAFYFNKGGLNTDAKRPLHRRIISAPGYLIAAVIAGLAPLGNALFFKALPSVIVLVSIPFVAVYKLTASVFKGKKVDAVNDGDDEVITIHFNTREEDSPEMQRALKLQELLYLGELDNDCIKHNLDMKSGYFRRIIESIRSLILIEPSYTEALLAAEIKYLRDRDATGYNKSINDIKNRSHATHTVREYAADRYNNDIDKEIEAKREWIDRYVEDGIVKTDTNPIPENTYNRNSLMFFADPPEVGPEGDQHFETEFGY